MTSLLEVIVSAVVIIVMTLGLIVLGGEPDIADAIRKYIDAQTENSQRECAKSTVSSIRH